MFLEVKNITKKFGETDVLKGIDFTLEKGQVLSIIGSSGSGKTTLLRCLNFLETPDTGTVSVDGDCIFDAKDPKKKFSAEMRENRLSFGLVFQSFNLFPQYTVMENLMLAAHSLGLGSCWIHRAKEVFDSDEGKEILASFGIEGDYEGIGNCIVGYPDALPTERKPRKDNYIYRA